MMWLWIGLALLVVFSFLSLWGMCAASAHADACMEKAFQEIMARRSQNADGVLHEEVEGDADGT